MAGRAFHVMCLAEQRDGERGPRFIQNFVVQADESAAARERITVVMVNQGARVITFYDDETYEVDPTRVKYPKGSLDEHIVGLSGRFYIIPRRSLLGRLVAAIKGRLREP